MDLHLLVDVHGRRLGDQQAARSEELGDPAEKGVRVAADPDVPVDEQRRVPAPLPRQRLEHRPAQRLPAEPDGVCDGRLADVDPEHGPPP
ncbi:hypothetical protein GCM10023080_098420 [Streptomyces pseudoechinosporeus]